MSASRIRNSRSSQKVRKKKRFTGQHRSVLTISKFQAKYGTQADPLDFLYLTAFQHTVALIQAEKRNDTEPLIREIEKINLKIDEFVKE